MCFVPYLPDSRWREIDFQIGITHHGADLSKHGPGIKSILVGEQVGGGDEILGCSNQRFTISRSDEIVLDLNTKKSQSSILYFFVSRPNTIHLPPLVRSLRPLLLEFEVNAYSFHHHRNRHCRESTHIRWIGRFAKAWPSQNAPW